MAGPPNPRILPAFWERILWQAIEEDAKDKVVFTSGAQGDWWVAARSGHTQEEGKDLKNKNRDLALNEQAMKGMSYILRQAAGTLNV